MQFQQQLSRQCTHFCRTRHRRAFVTQATSNATMVALSFKQTAVNADQRLTLSGACAATLPEGHSHDVILFGGYHEAPDKQRTCTNAAWIYSAKTGAWEPVQYTSAAVPQPRCVDSSAASMHFACVHASMQCSATGSHSSRGEHLKAMNRVCLQHCT